MYHYLTGAASWYLLTMITEVFGVRGKLGNLVLEPKLVVNQFDNNGSAGIQTEFAGKTFKIEYVNKARKDYGEYEVLTAELDGKEITDVNKNYVMMSKDAINELSDGVHKIVVTLG